MKNMKKRLFGLVMAGVMMMSLAVSAGAVNAAAEEDSFDYYADFTIEKNGCTVKDDGVYDRDGELLFPLKDGYTDAGRILDRDFQVVYADQVQEIQDSIPPVTRADRVINSGAYMPYNRDGNQGNNIGFYEALGDSASFAVTSANNASTYNAVWLRGSGGVISQYYPKVSIGNEISTSVLVPGEEFTVEISSDDCPRNGTNAFFTLTIRE